MSKRNYKYSYNWPAKQWSFRFYTDYQIRIDLIILNQLHFSYDNYNALLKFLKLIIKSNFLGSFAKLLIFSLQWWLNNSIMEGWGDFYN